MNKEYLIPIYTETGIYELFSFKYGSNREPYNLNLEILIENVDRNNIITILFEDEVISYRLNNGLNMYYEYSHLNKIPLLSEVKNSRYLEWIWNAGLKQIMRSKDIECLKHYIIADDNYYIEVISKKTPSVIINKMT